MLKKSLHVLWLLLVTLLVLVAVALTTARVWIPEARVYRAEVERTASQLLDKQVTIGRMQAAWRGINPVIRLKDVEVADPAGEHAPLVAREVRITIDAEQYLSQQAIKLAGIDVIGAELTVLRDTDGAVFLEGFRPAEDSELLTELLQMALTVHDVNVTYIDKQSGDPPQRFSRVSMSLRGHGDTHTLTGHALLPQQVGYRADIEAVLHGPASRLQDWYGRVYVRGESIALTEVLGRLLTDDQVIEGVADLRLWLNIGDDGLDSVSGEIDTQSLTISQHDENRTYSFAADTLRGQFGWRSRGDGWQFAVQNVLVTQQQGRWTTPNLSLAGRQDDRVMSISGESSLVVLDGFGALLPIIPGLSVEHRQLLGGLQPSGSIKDLAFSISSDAEATRVRHFSARFSGLSIEQSGVFPKLVGLDGRILGDSASGTLTIASHNAGIHDDRLFRELLPVESAEGDVRWQLTDGAMEIATDALTIKNADLAVNLKMGLFLPLHADQPSINLAIDVDHLDIGRAHAYLPAKVMSPKGVAWLDRSLKSGVVSNGQVVVNGRLDQIPFDKGEGILRTHLPVSNAVLDYNNDWSPVTGLDAVVKFTGRKMDIVSSRGSIRSTSLDGVHAQIRDIASPVLTLEGNVRGPLPVMLAELGSSPLGKTYGGFVDRVTTTGNTTLGLDIVVPLDSTTAPIEVAGRITLRNNTLQVNETDIRLTRIKGSLAFDDEGIEGDKLQAALFDHPASARVWTNKQDRVTHVTLDGPLDLFNRYIDSESFLGLATSGSSDWHVDVAIRGMPERGKRANVGVSVSSDLVGTVIDLPAPYGKDSETRRSLRIEAARVDTAEKELQLNYADLLNGVLVIGPAEQQQELQRGAIVFGTGKPVLPGAEKLVFSGNVAAFRLTEWQPHLEGGKGDGGLPLEFLLNINELEVLGYQLGNVSIAMKSAGKQWQIEADGASIAGDIELSTATAGLDTLSMNLQRLQLNSATRQQQPAGMYTDITPGTFPDLQVSVQDFVFDETSMGLLEISSSKQSDSVYFIERAVLSSELLAARLSGNWRLERKRQVTNVDFEITDGRMDRLMDLFGYQKSINEGTLTASMRLAWPGSPWAFTPPMAEGKVEIRVTDGQLVDVQPGAAGRVLGLISLNNLPRRLSLDFSDLFAKGFSFDEIDGSFVLDDGNAYTNDLFVNGPAALIEISGRIGLADQDYDELVTVTPYVKTGLPLAGTLAGGPAVGAVLLVAETLLEDRLGPLNRIARKQYTVTGPWSDPVIDKIEAEPQDTAGYPTLDVE
jgi:uncharacterized protein (TIGR02099 family)